MTILGIEENLPLLHKELSIVDGFLRASECDDAMLLVWSWVLDFDFSLAARSKKKRVNKLSASSYFIAANSRSLQATCK